MKQIIDLTWCFDLQTADKAKENLEKAWGGHLENGDPRLAFQKTNDE